MDWFFRLESPTQVAIIGVISGFLIAATSVLVAIINNRRNGGGKAEIAAMTMDASTIRQVAAAIEGLSLAIMEENKVGEKLCAEVGALTDEVEELRREVRELTKAASRLS